MGGADGRLAAPAATAVCVECSMCAPQRLQRCAASCLAACAVAAAAAKRRSRKRRPGDERNSEPMPPRSAGGKRPPLLPPPLRLSKKSPSPPLPRPPRGPTPAAVAKAAERAEGERGREGGRAQRLSLSLFEGPRLPRAAGPPVWTFESGSEGPIDVSIHPPAFCRRLPACLPPCVVCINQHRGGTAANTAAKHPHTTQALPLPSCTPTPPNQWRTTQHTQHILTFRSAARPCCARASSATAPPTPSWRSSLATSSASWQRWGGRNIAAGRAVRLRAATRCAETG